MANYSTNEFKSGLKILIDGDPYTIVENEMVKPGKGQAFNRVRVRNLKTGRTIERTWKSGDTVEAADVVDTDMQYLYSDGDFFHFMVPENFEQVTASKQAVGEGAQWLKDGTMCIITLWNGVPLQVDAAGAHGAQGGRDRPGRARRYRHRRLEAGEARDGRHGAGAAVHQRRRDGAHRHAHRRVPVARQGLSAAGKPPARCQALSIGKPWRRTRRVALERDGDQAVEAQGDAGAVGHAGGERGQQMLIHRRLGLAARAARSRDR